VGQHARREKTVAKKIRVKVFDDQRESVQDALAFEQGRDVNLRVTELPLGLKTNELPR
jgi:hypothetical protein